MNAVSNGGGEGGSEERLAAAFKALPQETPPADLEKRIMQTLRRRDGRFWSRMAAWTRRPFEIRFTVVPTRLVPALACLLLAGYFALPILAPVPREQGGTLPGSPAPGGLVRLEFSLQHPGARTVALIGSFNGWHREVGRMEQVPGSRHWRIVVEVPPGRYEYAFLVDGETLLADPEAAFHQPDGFGFTNSIVFANYNEI